MTPRSHRARLRLICSRAVPVSLGVLLACALALAAVPGTSNPARSDAPRTSGQRVASLLDYLASHPGQSGGYTVNPAQRTVTVRMVRPSAGLLPVAETTAHGRYDGSPALAGSWTIRTVPARASISQLQTIASSIPRTEPFATESAQGQLTSWGVDPAADNVAVGLTQVSPDVVQASHRVFGDLVSVHQEDRPTRAGRGDDTPPFSAGNRIFVAFSGCTNAFRVTKGDSTYMLTAGHCAPDPGFPVFTGASPTTADTFMGTLDYQVRSGGWDSALIGGESYGTSAWVSPDLNGTASVRVDGYADPVSDQLLCTSGAYSFLNCNFKTSGSTTVCVTFSDGVTTCHLTSAVAVNGAKTACAGDSGGPVMTPGKPATAVGVIIGAGPICTAGGTLYYHAVGPLLEHWDATFG